MDQVYLFEPLALEYLGAGAQLDGHEVRLLDARIDRDINGAIRAFRPEVVGLTGFTSHVNIIKAIAGQVKGIDPGITVIIGGHHATVRPAITLNRRRKTGYPRPVPISWLTWPSRANPREHLLEKQC